MSNQSPKRSKEEMTDDTHQGNSSVSTHPSDDKDMSKLPDNTSSRHYRPSGYGPPRNMDELSDLIFGMREDIFSLKGRNHRDYRRRRRSSSYSRSRSRERACFRSRSRSRSRDSRSPSHTRSRRRRSRAHSRRRSPRRRSSSHSRSPCKSRRRVSRSPSRGSSRAPSRDGGSNPKVNKGSFNHPISDSDEETKPSANQKELDNQPTDDPDNPFCGYVKQIAGDSKVSDPVDSWVAQFIEKALSSPPSKEVLTEICDKYKRPENVVNLQVPAVEGAVWLAISSKARTKDNLRQKHQETFIKMLVALSSAANDLNNKYMADQKSGCPQLEWLMEPLTKLKDAIMVGGFHNLQDITKRRRFDLEYFMPDKYRRLCTDFTAFPPTPTALLGENIEDAVRQMDLTNKLSQKLDKNSKLNNSTNRPHQSNNSSYNNNKKGQNFKNPRKNPKGRNYDGRSSNSNYNQSSNQPHYDRNKPKGQQDFRKGGPQK